MLEILANPADWRAVVGQLMLLAPSGEYRPDAAAVDDPFLKRIAEGFVNEYHHSRFLTWPPGIRTQDVVRIIPDLCYCMHVFGRA